MSEPLEFQCTFTWSDLRRCDQRVLRHLLGPVTIYGGVIVVCLPIVLLSGGKHWFHWVMLGALGAYLLFVAIWYLSMRRSTRETLSGASTITVRYRLEKDRFCWSSPHADSSIPWAAVHQAYDLSDVLLIKFKGGGYVALLAESVPAAARERILSSGNRSD